MGMGAEEAQRLSLPEALGPRPFLRYERPTYQNYAFDLYAAYPEHTWPGRQIGNLQSVSEISRPQALWGPLGDYLATGYDLFTWIERPSRSSAGAANSSKTGPGGS